MKKLFSLLIFFVAFSVNAQIITNVDKLRINEITEMQEAGKVLVIDSNNLVQWVSEDKITPDLSDYYTKIDVDAILEDYYDKGEVDALLSDIDLSDYYTKTEVDDLLSNLPSGTPNLADVLGEGNSANNMKITDLDDGVDAGDAVNKSQLDALESPFEVVDVTQQAYSDIAIVVKDFDNIANGMTYQEGAIDFGVSRDNIHEMGLYSFKTGFDNTVLAPLSFVTGQNNTITGAAGVSFGFNNFISGAGGVSFGENNEVTGTYSTSLGLGLISNNFASLVIGRYSTGGTSQTGWLSGSPIFKVGNGSSASNRKNAYTLYNDGRSEQEKDMEVTTIGQGFVMKSPDGTRWRITVDNNGDLSAEQL